jgi:hypothetical protein
MNYQFEVIPKDDFDRPELQQIRDPLGHAMQVGERITTWVVDRQANSYFFEIGMMPLDEDFPPRHWYIFFFDGILERGVYRLLESGSTKTGFIHKCYVGQNPDFGNSPHAPNRERERLDALAKALFADYKRIMPSLISVECFSNSIASEGN